MAKKSKTFDIEGVGTITLLDNVDLYRMPIDWVGEKAYLYIDLSDEASMVQAGQNARAILENQEMWDEEARECAARCCVDLANKWAHQAVELDGIPEDEVEYITEAEFAERIKLYCFAPKPDGSIEFEYDDDDIFLGHDIVVEATMENGVSEAYMP